MSTKTGSASVGSKKLSGERDAQPAPAATAHVSVTFDDTVILTRSDFMACCKAIAEQLIPRQ